MEIKIQWFDGDGTRAGTEQTTLEELRQRLDGKAEEIAASKPGMAAIFRLDGTGEVARCWVA